MEPPVDERRHGEVAHLAKALSARDLLKQVAKRCPEGVAVPSKQAVAEAVILVKKS